MHLFVTWFNEIWILIIRLIFLIAGVTNVSTFIIHSLPIGEILRNLASICCCFHNFEWFTGFSSNFPKISTFPQAFFISPNTYFLGMNFPKLASLGPTSIWFFKCIFGCRESNTHQNKSWLYANALIKANMQKYVAQ